MQTSSYTKPGVTSSLNEGFTISLTNAGKRFNRDWIFRNLTYVFEQGRFYAVTGPNGSGKSTLLQCIAASTQLNEGVIEYRQTSNTLIATENIFSQLAIVAPYLEVIEEMTACEFLRFHSSFKPLIATISIDQILEIIGLQNAINKQIRFYSSGMKQRIKLAQAIFADTPILLLDEPCTNLDATGYKLYHQLINDYCSNKIIIVSSNDVNEYDFCEQKLNILDYK